MKESFKSRAIENLEAAELLFENGKYNASANRAYYAAFHLAIAALFSNSIKPNIDHRSVQSLFSDLFFSQVIHFLCCRHGNHQIVQHCTCRIWRVWK